MKKDQQGCTTLASPLPSPHRTAKTIASPKPKQRVQGSHSAMVASASSGRSERKVVLGVDPALLNSLALQTPDGGQWLRP